MRPLRARRCAGLGLLVLAAASAPGSEVPKKTPPPQPAAAKAPGAQTGEVNALHKRKTSLGFESSTISGRVGTYLDFQMNCLVESNENAAIKECPIVFELDGAPFTECVVKAYLTFAPGAARCGITVPEVALGAHVLRAHIPASGLLEPSPAATSTLQVNAKAWTLLSFTGHKRIGSGGLTGKQDEVSFELVKLNGPTLKTGKPLSKRMIQVKIDGVTQPGLVQTDTAGRALFTVSSLGKPSRVVQASFPGDGFAEPAEALPQNISFAN